MKLLSGYEVQGVSGGFIIPAMLGITPLIGGLLQVDRQAVVGSVTVANGIYYGWIGSQHSVLAGLGAALSCGAVLGWGLGNLVYGFGEHIALQQRDIAYSPVI